MNKRDSYDFFEYCEYVKNILSPSYQIKEKYCEYIKYILKLYHELKDEGRQGGFPHIYKKELDLYKNTIGKDDTLSILKKNCNIDDSFTKVPRSVDNLNLLQRKHEKKLTKLPENIIEELPSSKIYAKLSEDASDSEHESKYCNNLKDKDQMKKICKKMENNIKTLPNNSEMNGLSHRDRCTYLNFWIYGEISKLHTNEDKNLTDITDVANLIDANIKINKDLIKDDFDVNYNAIVPKTVPRSSATTSDSGDSQPSVGAEESLKNGETTPPNNKGGEGSEHNKNVGGSAQNGGTEGSRDKEGLKESAKFVKHYELSKHEPCYFNYDCTFSECREMKHLFEYFKNYDKIKEKFDCAKAKNDKYFKYFKYISFLYNKHKEDCCSLGAEICPDYFLSCDEYYNPNKIVSAIESSDIEACNKIKKSPISNIYGETSIINPEEENNMYIKYFTCSYVTDLNFGKKGLRCQQPGYSAHLNDKISARRNVIKPQNNTSGLDGKKIIVNGKTINVVLISDPYAKITGENTAENSMPNDNYTLFPEIRGVPRKAYVKQGEEACKNGEIKEGMEEYCRKSKRYNKIINLSNSQSANVTLKKDIENWEDIVIPDDTSFLNEILQRLPVRMGAVSLASLGAITMLFMYYKV
ncbi:hypothetical protein PVNG_06426 [Plasmodium vivax North Korean]|uniref:Uncharacterized protein n=1 Tax=Plasmodium vivax North Korean TaxID=1035514 RepID=A0A0J9TM28_PLAVI|nr:hypothetical protein PVNG_06426 [Plasmodium vivax North Korean]